ncbi:Zinc finger protein CONSTANS-LIKE 5 [Forsythia ovata]|uniref:Zinc finger protein CONSTANS-LIKE 5 n=1 Tax=Forsythia ovata TaxID=205694 RepID=A0ABD1R329_9LAMI
MGMAKDGGGAARAKFFPAVWNVAAKSCDYCKSTAALLFCRVDSAFMCMACDAKVHKNISHERVWMCEVCEQAPATVTCKADAAALCVTCDRDIHSANPLSRRHERSPVVPFFDTAESVVKSTATTGLLPINESTSNIFINPNDPWNISANPDATKLAAADTAEDMKPVEFLYQDTDQFLDFDYPICSQADSVVPASTIKFPPVPTQVTDFSSENRPEIGFTTYTTPSLSLSVSSSSLDVGVVPDRSCVSDTSYPFAHNMSSSGDPSGNQLSGMDREARVLRYKEKRKNRKFEKTIRYASRKAYAETRPRIKGRFAKRTEVESEIDRMFSYGIVPSLL